MKQQQPKTKAEQIRAALQTGNDKKALQIAKNFWFGLTKEQKRAVDIAAEFEAGNGGLYLQMGINPTEIKADALATLRAVYL